MSEEHCRRSGRDADQRPASLRVSRWLLGISGLLMLAACSKTPSFLWAHVSVDEGVPPLSVLHTTVVSLSHPELDASTQQQSLVMGDGSDHVAPFAFPVIIPISLNAEFVGDVMLTVDGLNRETEAVLASGTVATMVVASKEMHVGVTLSLVAGAGGAGGAE